MSWFTGSAARSTRTRRCCTRFEGWVMFSALVDPLRRNIAVRLSLWYALIFSLSGLALLAFAYYLLAAAIGGKDREVLEARWKEVAAVYEAGGLGALRSWWDSEPPQVQ